MTIVEDESDYIPMDDELVLYAPVFWNVKHHDDKKCSNFFLIKKP